MRCTGVQNLPHPERVLTYRTVFCCMHGGKPVNVSSSITPLIGERLADIRPNLQWIDINWEKVEEYVNTLANLNYKSS